MYELVSKYGNEAPLPNPPGALGIGLLEEHEKTEKIIELLRANQKLTETVVALEATSGAQDRIINNLIQYAVNLKMEALRARGDQNA